MKRSEQINELAKALVDVQKEIKNPEKTIKFIKIKSQKKILLSMLQ